MTDGVIQNFSMTSSADALTIRRNDSITAKVSEADASISGGARLTLEQGAELEITNGRTLSVEDGGEIVVNTDTDGSTTISVASGAELSFSGNAKLIINIVNDFASSDPLSFAVISFEGDSPTLNSLVIDETLFLESKGARFTGVWDYLIQDNKFIINITEIPEPATYAMIFGALVLGVAIYRGRQKK